MIKDFFADVLELLFGIVPELKPQVFDFVMNINELSDW